MTLTIPLLIPYGLTARIFIQLALLCGAKLGEIEGQLTYRWKSANSSIEGRKTGTPPSEIYSGLMPTNSSVSGSGSRSDSSESLPRSLGAELDSGGECRPTGSPSGAGTAMASVDIIDDEGASYDRVLGVRGVELFCPVVVVENLDVVEGGESVAVANV